MVAACAALGVASASAAPAKRGAPRVAVAPAVPAPSSPAAIARIACVAACDEVRPGSRLRLRGRALRSVDEVVFAGAEGEADDVAVEPVARRRRSVDVRVPLGAVSGPLALVDRGGAWSAPSDTPLAVGPVAAAGGPSVEFAVRSPRAFFDSALGAGLTYVVHAAAPIPVAIDVVRTDDDVVVQHWDVPPVVPETLQTVSWDGLADGRLQPGGRYEFRVSVAGVAAAAVAQEPAEFDFARDRFPILGRFEFGTGAGAFGGGRGHQGQDVFADCGTPLVAAHGGVVQYTGYHFRAGNYLVIDNAGSGRDYAYMHLRDPALVAIGDRVWTGQPIGFVGDTGDASACHLHFESWTAPGWYAGGRPVDPLPALRAWAGAR